MSVMRSALQSIAAGNTDRDALRRQFAPDGDAILEGLASRGFIDERLDVTVSGIRALADREWQA